MLCLEEAMPVSICQGRLLSLFAGLLLAGTAAMPATVFTDQSTFVSALQPGFYLEDFSSLTPGDQFVTLLNFSQNGFAYSASAANTLWINSAISNSLSTNVASDVITLNFTSGNVTAVGGFFYPTDFSENLTSGNIALALSDGTMKLLTNPGTTTFTGFTTSPGVFITSLTVSPESGQWATIDDLYVGAVASSEVPEPSLTLLLALGLALTGWKSPRFAP